MPALKPSRLTPFTPDDRQRQAIEHVHGPMLVIAGAGTGKTSVLTHRIERLVADGHARPDQILALTYTINAANEMRERVCRVVGNKNIQAHTFHDYCLKLLKSVDKAFGVLDDKDLWIYLRRRIRELHLEHYIRAANIGQFLTDLLEFVNRCHDELVTPDQYAAYVDRIEQGKTPVPRVVKSKTVLEDAEVLGRCREIARVFSTLENWLEQEKLGTFSHMITRAHHLLMHDDSVLSVARAGAKFILADEFQDANFAQIKLLARLAGTDGNIFAVGDPDQAIFRFRGASSAAFQLFLRNFPQTRLVVLDKNRRSTTAILRTAFAVIDQNPPAFSKDAVLDYTRSPLQSARDEESEKAGLPIATFPVTAILLKDKSTEGPDLVAYLQDLQRKTRCKWSDFGVLYRQHSHRDDLVQSLAEAEIPFVIESMDISDTPEARDLFACLNAVVADDDVSWFRVAALPCFRVDPEQLRQLMRKIAKEQREQKLLPLATVLDQIDGGAEVVAAVRGAREEITRRSAKGRSALDIIIRQFALDPTSPIVQAATKFVTDWEQKKINKTTDLPEFLDYLAYFREAGGVIPLQAKENENAVRLMTAHGAKGLEFPHVFILRAVKPSFPNAYRETLVAFPRELRDPDSCTEADDKTLHEQEERRLFYVAMTRARDTLRIYAREGTGKTDKTPPGYLRELIADRSIGSWFRSIPAGGAQATLNIAAAGSPLYPAESRSNRWFEMPVVEGLHKRLSASAVDTYERCGLRFKLERDWRIPGRPAAAMLYGGAIHRALKTYFDALRMGRPKTEDELIDIFCHDLADAKIQESYQHELYQRQGLAQLREFLASARALDASQVLQTEEPFEIRIDDVVVAGRIDRIDQLADGTVAIIDYKTGKPRVQEDADESLQLSLYAIAAEEKWGYMVGALVFYNLDGNVPVRTVRSSTDLLAARERVRSAAQGIADNVFRPTSEWQNCNFCPYRSLCPEREKRIPRISRKATASA